MNQSENTDLTAENYAVDKWKDKNDYALELCIEDFKAGHSHATASLIQTIENRVKELEDKITTPNGFQKTWLTQRQHELKELLTLIKS